MRTMKKLMVLMLSVLMVLGTTMVTSFAAGDGTISVKKNYKGQEYTLYKLFDATTVEGRTEDATDGISYKLMSGKTDLKATVDGATVDGATWFDVDGQGNVSLKDDATLFTEAFNKWAVAYGAKTGSTLTATQNNDTNVKWTELDDGYYFITTSTGSLVTVDSIAPDVEVDDKNTVPSVDKDVEGEDAAYAEIGKEVTYTAEITVGKGSKNLVFHDKMSTGLAFSGNDKVTVVADSTIEGTWYTIKSTPDDGDTLTITFKDGIAEGTKITVTYKATVTADAVTALNNTATVSYGDKNTKSEESEAKVYNAKISVVKYDGKKAETKYLAGAGFKLKNAAGKYYNYANNKVTWVDSEDDATEHVSGSDGKVEPFIGLEPGKYTLVESTVPEGYNKAADTEVEITDESFEASNLNQTAEVENYTGTELPSTGGMGTTIIYVIGGVLVAVCGIMLVAKKRTSDK